MQCDSSSNFVRAEIWVFLSSFHISILHTSYFISHIHRDMSLTFPFLNRDLKFQYSYFILHNWYPIFQRYEFSFPLSNWDFIFQYFIYFISHISNPIFQRYDFQTYFNTQFRLCPFCPSQNSEPLFLLLYFSNMVNWISTKRLTVFLTTWLWYFRQTFGEQRYELTTPLKFKSI